jgi:asparagine synthase (glutamine-hydrolysing)
MCGILAVSSQKYNQIEIAKSLKAIWHRGPDDSGTFISEKQDAHFGQVRLSIIDLSNAGHQPMIDASGRYVITFNGEIYNFKSLKIELELNYGIINWKSTTDTEVILEGFSREGRNFLSKLNGIFALAIYDIKDRLMFVLRDPIGIKPLYYTHQFDSYYFSSEIKGLLSFQNLKRTIRKQSLVEQLAYMYVPEPNTMYEEYKKVEPGICYTFQDGIQINATYLFNDLNTNIINCKEDDIAEILHNTLADSVKRQLISDVPISLFLSGGLDSSTIAYEAVNAQANIKNAYTISFSKKDNLQDQQSSDIHYAKKMASILGIELNVIEADYNFLNLLTTLIDFMEDGISDPSAINTYLISKAAREDGVKVMLSGQGADEYLCGYRRYKAEYLFKNMPSFTKLMLPMIANNIPSSIFGRFKTPIRRFKKLSDSSQLSTYERLSSYFIWSKPEKIKSLFLDKTLINPDEQLKDFFKLNNLEDINSALLLADQKYDLRSLNLSYTDKLSMAVGLEVRVPFLDFEMIKLMNTIPRQYMMKNGEQKYILKKAMEPYIPKEIIYREKAGFALPIRSWFSKENEFTKHYFSSERLTKQNIFDVKVVNQILEEQFSGKQDHTYLIFAMLCQQIWLEKQLN